MRFATRAERASVRRWLTRCTLPIGRGETIRSGFDVAILALGAMVLPAERAAELLAAEGISASVVNARFVKPLDERLILELASRCGAIVTVEENVKAGGFGSAVLELLTSQDVRVPTRILAVPDLSSSRPPRVGCVSSPDSRPHTSPRRRAS